METCWSKIANVEAELDQQNPENLILFIKCLASKKLLSKYMFSGFLGGAANYNSVWSEAHAFFKDQI